MRATHARGADRRRRAASTAADAARPPGRRAHERRRARDPVRRRLRSRGARAARSSARRRASARGAAARARRASPIPSTCSARRPTPTYEAALPLLLADPGVDARDRPLRAGRVAATAEDVAAAIARAAAASSHEKPVLAVVMSAEGIPAALRKSTCRRGLRVSGVGRAGARARRRAGRLAAAARSAPRPSSTASTRRPRGVVVERALSQSGDGWLDPADTRELLLAYGIPLVPERVASTSDEAVAAAEALGYPVVVKTAAAGAHKTETGGIALDLATRRRRSRRRQSGSALPVVVQPMIAGGTSCWPASSRTRSSARSSRSAPAASSPS